MVTNVDKHRRKSAARANKAARAKMLNAMQKRESETLRSREAVLKNLGFSSYQQFLDSNLWAGIRARVLADGPKCAAKQCTNQATQVHHIGYGSKTLQGYRPHRLYPVCDGCYQIIWFRSNGSKRRMSEAKRISSRILAKIKRAKPKCKECGRHPKKGTIYCRPCLDRVRREYYISKSGGSK